MSGFASDGSKGDLGGGIQAVYIDLGDGDIAEVFPIQYHTNTKCNFLGSPSEKGTLIFENKVQTPITVDMTAHVPSSSWDCLEAAYDKIGENKVVLGAFYAKNTVFNNMMVESIEEIGVSEKFDCIEARIRLKEYLQEGNTMH